ncbi:DUF1801 domain-containing protein [Leucobacter viscericola]|uniref:DUF1801 domain-containing protein n=1 Tax=Leucobacter viscericola TaxID=2714935 RepID=UPI001982310A|nr:DUF1801 domain-containing protein [Leucobacter viscericola]
MTELSDPAVREAFESYDAAVRAPLLQLRELIFDVAAATDGVGALTETLKWGQPSYLTEATQSGTMIRLAPFEDAQVGVFVHCQTSLISDFRGSYPDLNYSGTRAIVLSPSKAIPTDAMRLFFELALTYKRRGARR